MMADLLSGLGYVRLTDAIEVALDAVKGHTTARTGKFLAALHAAGFDVTEMAGGPVVQKPTAEPANGMDRATFDAVMAGHPTSSELGHG